MAPRPLIAVTFAGEDWEYGASEAEYLDAVRAAGGEPRPVRPGEEALIPDLLRAMDGVLFSGGDDMAPEYYGETPRPELRLVNGPRDRLEFLLARAVLAAGLPALGICNGVQVLNVASGGSLWQDIPSQVPGAAEHGGGIVHQVRLEEGTRLAAVVGAAEPRVNSFHHQAVARVGRGWRVAARSPDGVIEALERPGEPFLLGVQWHPERPGCDPGSGAAVVAAFVAAAARRIPSRAAPPS